MSVDQLVRTQTEEQPLLPAGRHAIVPRLTGAIIHWPAAPIRKIEGSVTTAPTGMEINLSGLVEPPARERSATWPFVGILETFPGLHVAVRTVLWSGVEGLGLGMLTLAGISKPAAFDVEVRGISVDVDGTAKYFVWLATWINSEQWGVQRGWSKISFALAVTS